MKIKVEKTQTCALCKEKFKGFGHNPEPLAKGRCCEGCNYLVIVERIKRCADYIQKNVNQIDKKK
tara:strand:+ start:493 stop:687 length:195 start_codon:yes stop_codon:yes gene_type:complete